jgi:hypothetical protein
MKLITEEMMDIEYLVESTNDKKSHYISGVFMQADTANRNGRTYPKGIMESELKKYQNSILEKRALGELGHPQNPSLNLDKVSHLITNLKFEGNDIIGKAKILNTPMGNIAQNFLEEGVKLGVSSRGVGSVVNRGGINEVQSDYRLSTVDIVHEPSGIDCWVNGIMENQEWVYVNGIYTDKHIESAKKEILSAKSGRITEMTTTAFHNFLNNIK